MKLNDLKVLVDALIDQGYGDLDDPEKDVQGCGHPRFPYADSPHCATDTDCHNYAGKYN